MTAFLAMLAGLVLAFCQWLIFIHAPVEATLGLVQKIFYMHLPLAIWALFSFAVVFAGSVAYLWRRNAVSDNISAAAAELGLLFSGLALISGMIWARRSWGVWWTWDPRLTTTLIMWFVYAACMILRHMELPLERRRVICAIVGIVAFLDVPLVFFSARIFRSIHPAVFGTQTGGLEPEMLLAVIGCIAGIGLLWLALLLFRIKQLELEQRLEKLQLQELE